MFSFTSNETLHQCLGPLWIELYQFHWYSGIGVVWRNQAQMPQISCRDTSKVIQSLQIIISHQMRPYSSFKALCGLSCACFTGTCVLGQIGEAGLQHPKSCTGTHEEWSKVFISSSFNMRWGLPLCKGDLGILLYLPYGRGLFKH